MKRALFTIVFAAFLAAFAACGSSKTEAPAQPEKAPATQEPAQPAAQPAVQAEPAPAVEPAAPGNVAAEGAAEAEGAEDPDDETYTSDGTQVDRDKLARAYEEVYCAQKKNEMDKLLDIYKNYGFEKPEDFITMWMEAAKDTNWVTKVAHDATSKCK